MDEIETQNHPDAVCSLHGISCRVLGEVLIERDALRSRLSAIDTAKAGKPPIPVWHEHDRYNYAEPEHRFRARLEDWGREGWDAAAALRVEADELREKLDDCLETLRLIERVTRPDGDMADAAVNLLIRSCRWHAYGAHEGVHDGEVQP